MFSIDYRRRLVLLVLNVFYISGALSACASGVGSEIVVIAFISVHDETTECDLLSLRGLQQMAILQKTMSEINQKEASNHGMHLSLHVVSTCSFKEDRANTALKNLIMSHHQVCPNPPLLIGFIGPEQNVKIVQKITAQFHKYHILPFMPDFQKNAPDNFLLHVGNNRLYQRSKIILATLNQLKWKSIYVVIAADLDRNYILNHMFNELQSVCVTGLVHLPQDRMEIAEFYSNLVKEFKSTNSEGIVLIAEVAGVLRPLLQEMSAQTADESNPPILLYLYQIGIKSWELPRNFSIVILQETSEMKRGFSLNSFHNRTLWNEYAQFEVDYKRDAFSDIYDSSLASMEYALQLYWNAAKYAKKIKCDIGKRSASSVMCHDMLHLNPSEWKSFLYKASYNQPDSLRKISLDMNVPVTVRIYFMSSAINVPQLIGCMTDIGIVELKMNLQTAVQPKSSSLSFKRCTNIPSLNNKSYQFDPIPMDHESNWLAVFSKLMKNKISLNGTVSPELSEQINDVFVWAMGIIIFILGLLLLTKFVYRIFRVQTQDEWDEAKRQKQGRTSRIVSA